MAKLDKEALEKLKPFLMVVYIIAVLIPLAIAITWFLCFLSWVGITSSPPMDTHRFLAITAVVVTMICAALGLGAMADLFPLPRRVQIALWTGVILGIVGAVVEWLHKLTP